MLLFTVIALAVAALRFVPSLGISSETTDFAGGIAVGLLVGLIVTWWVERGSR